MKKPIALKLNGKPLDLNPPRRALEKLAAFLEKLPNDELLTIGELVTRSNVGQSSIRDFRQDPKFSSYIHRASTLLYFGNPRAIVALKQFLAERGK
jgi:hypothetical protein